MSIDTRTMFKLSNNRKNNNDFTLLKHLSNNVKMEPLKKFVKKMAYRWIRVLRTPTKTGIIRLYCNTSKLRSCPSRFHFNKKNWNNTIRMIKIFRILILHVTYGKNDFQMQHCQHFNWFIGILLRIHRWVVAKNWWNFISIDSTKRKHFMPERCKYVYKVA